MDRRHHPRRHPRVPQHMAHAAVVARADPQLLRRPRHQRVRGGRDQQHQGPQAALVWLQEPGTLSSKGLAQPSSPTEPAWLIHCFREEPFSVSPACLNRRMATTQIHDVVEGLEKANANLEADLLPVESARELLDEYAKAKKLASYGEAVLARRIDDAAVVARAAGTSMGRARKTLETGAALKDAPEVGSALATGEISLDQAGEIAKAEQAKPGSAGGPPKGAKKGGLHFLPGAP